LNGLEAFELCGILYKQTTLYPAYVFLGVMVVTDVYKAKRPRRVRHLHIRGVDYSINEWGESDNPLLMYLHGWGDTGSTFQFVVDQLEQDWFVVAPDWRGFGGSSGGARGYWFPDYLADLDALLRHYSPGVAARLVGHSMGGNVAGIYAGTFPDRVSSLANVEGFGLPDAQPQEAPARYRTWIQQEQATPEFLDYENFNALAKRVHRRNPGMTLAQAEFVAREWAEENTAGRVVLRADPAHKLTNPVLYRRAEAEACWQETSATTLLIAGRRSRFVKPDDPLFSQQEAQWIEDAGHMLHFERPEELARVIEEFLSLAGT
jgi:pimeloyl-ACP methyl ester carboxylesterase